VIADAELPLVSAVVACRNEAVHIERCLRSLLAADYPADRLEVIVADGLSDDGTRELVAALAAGEPRLRLVDNPRRVTPVAFNRAIAAAGGDVILLVGAHSHYPRPYVRTLVSWLVGSGADVVGGACITRPAGDGVLARAIAAGLAHPFGVGNAHFRIGVSAPRWVDTVAFGCYRRDVFTRVGGFDEELVRNQDDELNLRLGRHGGRLLLVPDVCSSYQARGSLSKLWRMYSQYGYFKPLVIRKVGGVLTARQVVPALFVLALVAAIGALATPLGALPLAAVVGSYAAASVVAATRAAPAHGRPVAAMLPVVFAVLHLAYGSGFLRGAARFQVARRGPPADAARLPMTR
jgi:glycosyltransferase involved in cell wall biosynthesis